MMIDLSNNERPFGLLSPEEQKAMRNCPYGAEVFYGHWQDHEGDYWDYNFVYRTKPAPVTKPSVDWGVFTDDVICITRDGSGGGNMAWTMEATYSHRYGWQSKSGIGIEIDLIASYDPGTCPDSEAIAYRPGCEPEGK